MRVRREDFLRLMKAIASRHNSRAKRKGVSGKLTGEELMRLYEDTCGLCASCLQDKQTELDHILSMQYGGLNTLDNVQFLCQDCHRNKREQSGEFYDSRRSSPTPVNRELIGERVKCPDCRKELDRSEFYVTPTRKTGISYRCRECHKAKYRVTARSWYEQNREKQIAAVTQRRASKKP